MGGLGSSMRLKGNARVDAVASGGIRVDVVGGGTIRTESNVDVNLAGNTLHKMMLEVGNKLLFLVVLCIVTSLVTSFPKFFFSYSFLFGSLVFATCLFFFFQKTNGVVIINGSNIRGEYKHKKNSEPFEFFVERKINEDQFFDRYTYSINSNRLQKEANVDFSDKKNVILLSGYEKGPCVLEYFKDKNKKDCEPFRKQVFNLGEYKIIDEVCISFFDLATGKPEIYRHRLENSDSFKLHLFICCWYYEIDWNLRENNIKDMIEPQLQRPPHGAAPKQINNFQFELALVRGEERVNWYKFGPWFHLIKSANPFPPQFSSVWAAINNYYGKSVIEGAWGIPKLRKLS